MKLIYYILLLFLFVSLIYLALQINIQEITSYNIIIALIIVLNIVSFLILYFKILEGNFSNYKLLHFEKYTSDNLIIDCIQLIIFYIFFTPKPFLDYILYYFLLFIFLSFYFSKDKLQLKKNN